MYATVIRVKELTGANVDDDQIRQAQAIVEVVSGRPESLGN
jgi:hypothetical protein